MTGDGPQMIRRLDGSARSLPVHRWSAPATPGERDLLRRLTGPVLDLGCGPGRLVAALAETGVPALGIEASPHAVAAARSIGAPVVMRSIFDRLPGEGRWMSVLLFDGNIGIGGAPITLLTRIRRLLSPRGCAVVETEPPGSTTVHDQVRLEHDGVSGAWFPWTWLDSDDVDGVAAAAGLRRHAVRVVDGRWFSVLAVEAR